VCVSVIFAILINFLYKFVVTALNNSQYQSLIDRLM